MTGAASSPNQDGASVCRFNYSQEFLQWALQPPGYQEDWVLGVRVSSSGKLVAFITGVPATVRYSLLWLSLQHQDSIAFAPRKHPFTTISLGSGPPSYADWYSLAHQQCHNACTCAVDHLKG